MAPLLSPLLLLSTILSCALSQDFPSVMAGSTFVYDGKEADRGRPGHESNPDVTFALTAESSTGDLYFHLESPQANQWVGVGIGSSMADALFLIAYASENGTGSTLSVRTAPGHVEPSAVTDVQYGMVWDEGLDTTEDETEGRIVVNAVCKGCANYGGDGVTKIDLADVEQPFIFAIGPPLELESDSVDGNLQQHILYGGFTLDMTEATTEDAASVPLPPYTMSASAKLLSAKDDNDPGSRIHGAVMSVVFVIILPLGALVLRVWNVKAHIIFQLIGWILFCMAFAGGAVASKKYNKSKDFASGHQVLGILLLIALLSQWVLGWVNHRTFKKTQQKTIFGKIHLYLGPAVIFLGWINGGLGFRFASNKFLAIPYTILIIIMIVVITGVRTCMHFRRKKQAKAGIPPPGMPAFGSQGGYQQQPPLASQAQQEHGMYRGESYRSDAGSYQAPPPPYGQGIQLQQYPSSQSVSQQGPVQPREGV